VCYSVEVIVYYLQIAPALVDFSMISQMTLVSPVMKNARPASPMPLIVLPATLSIEIAFHQIAPVCPTITQMDLLNVKVVPPTVIIVRLSLPTARNVLQVPPIDFWVIVPAPLVHSKFL
jgi:hypothetical protein